MPKNVFIVGVEEHNQRILTDLPDAEQFRFRPLLTFAEIYGDEIRLVDVLETAYRRLDEFDGTVDAIIGFWDFPVSTILPLLRERVGLPGARLASIVMCEHKYWSRLTQRAVIDEVPGFGLVRLHDTAPPAGLRYPMWLKPVKSFASRLAFKVHDDGEFLGALRQISEGIAWVGAPFDVLLEYLDLPPEIAGVGGQACLAEEAISGLMATVEGYRFQDEVHVYGIVDSVRYSESPSFLRYQYPSALPPEVCLRMAEIARTVVLAIGLERMTFNVEFFWDPDADRIRLLEINPRHSQSHAELFEDVDGLANHDVMLQLALGHEPQLPHRQGPYAHAAKWFVRRFTDGIVRREPTCEEITNVQQQLAGVSIELVAHTGDRLSALRRQDGYSYALANVYVGAATDEELAEKFEHVVNALSWEIEDVHD